MARVASLKNKFGRMIGWNNVVIALFGRELEGITDLSYDDGFDDKVVRGAGSIPIGKESGEYEAKCSMTIYLEELLAIQSKLAPGEHINSIPDFNIIVEYEYNGQIVKDVIEGVSFKDNGRDLKQGEGKIPVKLEMLPIAISWNAA